MKSQFVALVFASFFLTATAFADSPASLSVTTASDAKVYTVVYKSSEAGKVKVSIYTKSNQLVFTEVLTNVMSFKRPYNFSQLEEGEYTIVLEDKNGKQVETVNHVINRINSTISVKKLADTENKYVLNVITTGTEGVLVKIYDNANDLVHVQNVEVSGYFGLVYDLSKIKTTPASTVTFEISTASGKVETAVF
jgi:hypothetical protein